MNVEIFTLADHAEDYAGKLSILGTFDGLNVNSVPSIHPHCCLALRVRFQKSETGDHPFRLVLIDSDGNDSGFKVEGVLHARSTLDQESIINNLVVGMNGFPVSKTGNFHFDLVIDGQLISRLPLTIRLNKQHRAAA